METGLGIVRRPARKTHLSFWYTYERHTDLMQTVCGLDTCIGDDRITIRTVEMCGGATTKVVTELLTLFNDSTCCKRCTAALDVLMVCYRARDTGKALF